MERRSSPGLQKWIRKCLRREFENVIEESVEKSEKCSDIVEKIIHSRQMSALLDSMKNRMAETIVSARSESANETESRPNTSLSFASDLTAGEWDSKIFADNDLYSSIIDKISRDKPVHVRLAGYEILLNTDPANARNGLLDDVLFKALVDGIADENRSVFEASLRAHAKFLHYFQEGNQVFANLLNAFNSQYYSRQPQSDSLPTLISGLNYRLFPHEKLIRIMHLAIRFQEEILKNSARAADKAVEDVIEKFVIFLSTHSFGNTLHPKTLSALNILAILDPRADWSRRLMHGLKIRKIFISALAKSPTLLQQVLKVVGKGIVNVSTLRTFSNLSIFNEPVDACIAGNVIETLTYLHCLNLLAQLSNYDAGRALLDQSTPEFSISDFVTDLFSFLNKLAILQISQEFYIACSKVLELFLLPSTSLCNIQLYRIISESLSSCIKSHLKVWPHILDTMMRVMSVPDGFLYMITNDVSSDCPAINLIRHTAKLLEQPFSIMNTEGVLASVKVLEKLFDACHAYEIVQNVVENDFFSALSQFYSKLDNYFVENEVKTQQLDGALRRVLLKVVSIPFAMLSVSREPLLFEELIRGTIAPLRTSWNNQIASFVSSATYLELGKDTVANLASHVLTTLLSDTCEPLLDPLNFHEPWLHQNSTTFLHIFALFGLNLKCLTAFTEVTDKSGIEEYATPRNLRQLLGAVEDRHSVYHHLSLLSLNAIAWNLNVCLYLAHLLNFPEEFSQSQLHDFETAEEEDTEPVGIIDECTFLRSKIFDNWWSIRYKCGNREETIEEFHANGADQVVKDAKNAVKNTSNDFSDSDSEFARFLQESKSGLHDSSWVSQARELYRVSKEPMMGNIIISLLEQMQKAIPTAEWVDCFKWDEFPLHNEDFWYPEETFGIELTLRYAEECESERAAVLTATNLKQFFRVSYGFIRYTKPNKFDGFDWFLSTVYILCDGDLDRCKTFIARFIRLQSSIYMWPVLGKVIDRNNSEEGVTQFVFNHLLESIVETELPHIKYALESTSGCNWWQICNTMILQCFWGLLPWNEIMNYFVICILYPPDYMLYYCVSLLHHCRYKLMDDIASGRIWPEHMILDDYRCQDYVGFMDTLGKRYSNKVLPRLTLRKICTSDGM